MAARITEEGFWSRLPQGFQDRYDFSRTKYVDMKTKVLVSCTEHGDFEKLPGKLFVGQGCPQCSRSHRTAQQTLTTKEFLRRLPEEHKGKYVYDRAVYTGRAAPITVTCLTHGDFYPLPANHLRGHGCKKCAHTERGKDSRLTTKEFIRKSYTVHGEKYDYSQVNYLTSTDNVIITCVQHGEFEQRPANHLQGSGCPKCAVTESSDLRSMTLEKFWERLPEPQRNKYSYDKVEVRRSYLPITVTCHTHGDFSLPPSFLIAGVGCPKCNPRSTDTQSFVSKSLGVHEGRYGYGSTQYISSKTSTVVTCRNHGDFSVLPDTHLRGAGCYKCNSSGPSQGEQELHTMVQSTGPHHVQTNTKGLLSNPRLELDIYVPEKKVAIEFNGVYWHSSKFKDKDAHHNKFKMAEGAGIKLVQVWEDDWNLRRPIVEEHLKQVLGVSTLPKIAARKTKVVEVPYSVAKDFLNANHIQGAAGAAFHLSLQYEGDVVALASFKRRSDGDLELVRYATSANVQGGHSKLVTYVERNYTYNQLVTFADLTFGSGELYRKTGWVEDKFLSPDYQYLVGGQRIHKFNYRLKRFREDPDLQYVEGMSESQLAELNGLLRVYDAGKIRFVKPHPDDDTI